MKKVYSIIFAALAIILSTSPAFARKFKHEKELDALYFPRNEIYIQYGTPTILELVTMLKTPTNFEGFETTGHIFTGTPGVGYNFFLEDNFSIGIFGGYSFAQCDVRKDNNGEEGPLIYTEGVNNYVGQLSANWTYYQDDELTLQTGLYLGVSYMNRNVTRNNALISSSMLTPEQFNQLPSSSEQLKLAYHFTACKIRYGNTFGVFGELGFGFRGLVNVGFSIKL